MDILQVELLTNNIAATEKFYRNILDLNVTLKDADELVISAGNTQLTFKYSPDLNPVYHFAFNIPNNQLEEAFAWIQAKVEIMEVEPGDKIADFKNWNAKSFYFYDNNGNILEFIARYEINNQGNTAFNGSSILNISEIGVVTEDVTEQLDALINKYNLSAFPKQPPAKNFAAIGDDNGLLVLSVEGRHWYPTDRVAEKHSTRVVVRNNGQACTLTFNHDTQK